MNFEQALKEKWYGQGLNATPLLVGSAAGPAKSMLDHTGLIYQNFLFLFKEDWGEMNYYVKDLETLGKEFVKRVEQDSDYFKKIKVIYNKQMNESNKFFETIKNSDLSKLSEDEISKLFKKTAEMVDFSVGLSHVIEPFVLTTDIKIKEKLGEFVKNRVELNKIFSLLMSPIEESFLNRYEKKLKGISQENDEEKQNQLIEQVIEEYFWIRTTYAGRYILTKKEILEEIKSLKDKEEPDFQKISKEKDEIISRLGLPEKLISKIKATEFLTTWQDERKQNILTAVDYLERALEEISKRVDFDIKYLRYLMPQEVDFEKLKSKEFLQELKERRKGCVYLYDANEPKMISGKEYEEFTKEFKKEKSGEVKEISGMTASSGTVIGNVKVCTTIGSLKKVQEGDILVASMTRPEYLTAMRKASAIITDEGGITCHAAIVSRELNIPCIIGTKIATKVLKDGDLVEIKGNHGLIIILERSK
ncbi:MAG: PEP-utilizing enzyme [Candidatus Woesearchaeota archaeon]